MGFNCIHTLGVKGKLLILNQDISCDSLTLMIYTLGSLMLNAKFIDCAEVRQVFNKD